MTCLCRVVDTRWPGDLFAVRNFCNLNLSENCEGLLDMYLSTERDFSSVVSCSSAVFGEHESPNFLKSKSVVEFPAKSGHIRNAIL